MFLLNNSLICLSTSYLCARLLGSIKLNMSKFTLWCPCIFFLHLSFGIILYQSGTSQLFLMPSSLFSLMINFHILSILLPRCIFYLSTFLHIQYYFLNSNFHSLLNGQKAYHSLPHLILFELYFTVHSILCELYL